MENCSQYGTYQQCIEYIEKDYSTWFERKNSELGYDLVSEYATCSIKFYYLDNLDMIVCEFSIPNAKTNECEYYLHFQLNDFERFKELYKEMKEALDNQKNKCKYKILFSCTSGMTTGMFARKLQELSDSLNLNYETKATSYHWLYKILETEEYDMVLLAPQIVHLLPTVKSIVTDKIVLEIPPKIFGNFDYKEAISFIEKHRKKEDILSKEENPIMDLSVSESGNALIIAEIGSRNKPRIMYRIYREGQVTFQNTIFLPRETSDVQDLVDILDVVLPMNKQIDCIGISLAGIVDEGKVSIRNITNNLKPDMEPYKIEETEIPSFDLKGYLEKRYGISIHVENNTNSAILGYKMFHPNYHTLVYHSQPFGFIKGGQGIIVNDQPILGKGGIAGEVQFITENMNLKDAAFDEWTPEGMLNLVTASILSTISILGPELVLYRCRLVPDPEVLKNELLKYLKNEKYLPVLKVVEDPAELIFWGCLQTSLLKNNLSNHLFYHF